MNSPFGKLNVRDLLKGFGVAIGSAIISGLYALGQADTPIDGATVKPVILAGISAGIAYLIKNFFSNTQGNFGKLDIKP